MAGFDIRSFKLYVLSIDTELANQKAGQPLSQPVVYF
jgi:hypothetical protein